MNKTVLIGRLTDNPDVRENATYKMARFRMAVDRRFKKEGEPTADFIPCVAFGKQADFAEKYMSKGKKFGVVGRLQTGSYVNTEGKKVYTWDVVVEEVDFIEPKSSEPAEESKPSSIGEGFLELPEEDLSDLPFA